MKAKLSKEKDGKFHLWLNVGTKDADHIASDKPIVGEWDRNLLKYKLSLKNCEAIANGYDLDELRQKAYEKYDKDDLSLDEQIQRSGGFLVGYEEGFQKALEILGDKKFSEEDIRKAFFHVQNEPTFDVFKKSLQQTEWDVEVEMCIEYTEGGYPVRSDTPKLDAENCLILKRL